MTGTCLHCAAPFEVTRRRKFYCSQACFHAHSYKGDDVSAHTKASRRHKARKRGEDVPYLPLGAPQKKGPDNPNWKGDDVTDDSGRVRARRLYAAQPCSKCGATGHIDRHHRNGNTKDNSPNNIVCLCRRCHLETDGRLARAREYGKLAGKKRHEQWSPTTFRSGDVCPECGHKLSIVSSPNKGCDLVYIGCAKPSGGCGLRVGSYRKLLLPPGTPGKPVEVTE